MGLADAHFEPQALAAIHYNLSGSGRLRILMTTFPIALCPDTLIIIVPRGCALATLGGTQGVR